MQRSEFVEIWKIARAAQWTRSTTIRVFVSAEMAVRQFGRKGWYVSRQMLWARIPTVAHRLEEMEDNGEMGMPGRAKAGAKGGKASVAARMERYGTSGILNRST